TPAWAAKAAWMRCGFSPSRRTSVLRGKNNHVPSAHVLHSLPLQGGGKVGDGLRTLIIHNIAICEPQHQPHPALRARPTAASPRRGGSKSKGTPHAITARTTRIQPP